MATIFEVAIDRNMKSKFILSQNTVPGPAQFPQNQDSTMMFLSVKSRCFTAKFIIYRVKSGLEDKPDHQVMHMEIQD